MRSMVLFLFVLLAGILLAGPALSAEPNKQRADQIKEAQEKYEKEEPAAEEEEESALKHVLDDNKWHLLGGYKLSLPNIFGFQITKFMVLELIASLLVLAVYIPLARRVRNGEAPHGAWDNTFEVLLTFVRNEIAKPSLGEHHADEHVPFLWTMFLFILFNNLLGMFPFGGSATASITVTGSLALIVFFAIHGSAVREMGPVKYLKSFWPHTGLPVVAGFFINFTVFVIELISTVARNAVLAVRLFANMFAGHMVLATILAFITLAGGLATGLWATISLASVAGIVLLSLLEIFVAFLQAYIFTFLTALFMGMALHPSH